MKNPLYRRLPRELKSDFGKYIALFLFLTITVSFCSGFLVADGSTKSAYDESFEKYNIENGHFTLADKASEETLSAAEDENVTVYELFYKDREIANAHTVRVYKMRSDVDRSDLMQGEYPKTDDEIVIDRLYAENNGINVGDAFEIGDKSFTVCGFAALSDYSALFKNNTDMMFDANKFTVALVTDTAFSNLGESGLHYNYAWTNNDVDLTESEQRDKGDDLIKAISKTAVLTDLVTRPDNQAIMFTGEDMGGDKIMIQWLLYIVMVILAFAFAITARSTIEQEAMCIGTLRASGYTKGELLRHYLALPMIVTATAAVAGNILGYTFVKELIVKLYYHSYSLTTYVTKWNVEAFVLTTVIPCVIIAVVNLIVLKMSLSLPPLNFLRRDFRRKKQRKPVKLPGWKFLTRFRIRVILQNRSAYVTMFVGILFSSVLLMFGMMFSPLLQKFKTQVQGSKIADYQYVLKSAAQTDVAGAEKYAVTSLQNDNGESITVYGVSEDSEYLGKLDLSGERVYISNSLTEKYGISENDVIELSEKYEDKSYKLTVSDEFYYPAAMAVVVSRQQFNKIFDKDDDYFSGYFSNEKLTDIDDEYISSVITEQDLTVTADQLEDSMGMMFPMLGGFAVMLYILMIYLLAKMMIDKNSQSISMVKIIGYSDKEAGRLYSAATAIVVTVSLLISIPVSDIVIETIYRVMMLEYNGWLTYYIAPWIYPAMFAIGAAGYFTVHFIHMRRIRKIPLALALKNIE